MVKCSNCKYGHLEHLVNVETKEVVEEWYFCKALEETLEIKCALSDYPCDLYDEKLDDNKTKKSSA